MLNLLSKSAICVVSVLKWNNLLFNSFLSRTATGGACKFTKKEILKFKLIHKSINDVSFPGIIKLELRNTLPLLRRQNVVSFQPSMVNGTFQDSAKIFYTLPINLQSVTSFNTFCSKVKSFLLGQALAKFTNV